jgi:hypothetical protein
MEFRLVLRGSLPPNKRGTTDAKHRIRRELHPQLRTFGQQHPLLREHWKAEPGQRSLIEQFADEHPVEGFRFVPLVEKGAACALDILILRRDEPYRRVFTGAGDVDGRVKTLLDGLRMPQQSSEIAGQSPSEDEDPFFVLLEDDDVVYEFNVTTDRLYVPQEPDEPERDVVAVIRVRTRTFSGDRFNIHDLGP